MQDVLLSVIIKKEKRGIFDPMKWAGYVWIYILAMIFHLIIGWRLPLYAYMMCIDLPDDAVVIKRSVTVSDVCYWQILADTAFVSEHNYGDIKEDIHERNRFLMGATGFLDWSLMTPGMLQEWEHTSIPWDERDRLDEVTDRLGYHNWYSVSLSLTDDRDIRYLEIYSWLSAIVSLAVTTAICIALDIRIKKGKQKT